MNYQLLGNSGLRVSELCLGTMTFGTESGWGADKQTSRQMYDLYRQAGGNFVDTANFYTRGTSEQYVGEFMQGHRDQIVLATKYTDAVPGTDPNAGGNQRKNMMQSVEASLKRLKTDYIDLYWVHAWDFFTPVEEIMRGLDDLVGQGKILYVGVSDAPAWAVAEANVLASLRGWTPFTALQMEYNLAQRTPERELLPLARMRNLSVLAWSPLAGGLLTGKYSHPDGNGASANGPAGQTSRGTALTEQQLPIAQTVQSVATRIGCEPSQVALRWLLDQNIIPILGGTKVEQIERNLASLKLRLTAEQTEQLNTVSRIELGFPHEMLVSTRHYTYGGQYERIKTDRKRFQAA